MRVEAGPAFVAERDMRGEKGRDHAELTYRWDEVADQYEDLCRALTTRARTPQGT